MALAALALMSATPPKTDIDLPESNFLFLPCTHMNSFIPKKIYSILGPEFVRPTGKKILPGEWSQKLTGALSIVDNAAVRNVLK